MMFALVLAASTSFMAPASRVAAPMRASATKMSVNAASIPVKNVWIDFAQASDIPSGGVGSGFRYGQELAIANVGGKYYALSNKLPPTGQPATLAKIEKLNGKNVLVEPVSGTVFDLGNGKPLAWCPSVVGRFLLSKLVAPQDVPVFPVRKTGNKIQCLINVNAKAQFEAKYWRGVLDAQGKVDGGYY